jgi:23S rRNA pseudouridine2605 synthase
MNRNRMPDPKNNNEIRLHVFLARCGLGSRRKCEEYILDKRVSVNGVIESSLGKKINETDIVFFDNKQIRLESRKYYIALNKPPQYLCSNSDQFGRLLAIDLIKSVSNARLFHVGRLDLMSSGLVLYTNDGNFAQAVTHPTNRIEKEYVVVAKSKINKEMLEDFQLGVTIEDEKYKLTSYSFITPHKVRLILEEGKNREIRKVFRHYKINISTIHRTRIGVVTIKGLASGEHRMLTQHEIRWFFDN